MNPTNKAAEYPHANLLRILRSLIVLILLGLACGGIYKLALLGTSMAGAPWAPVPPIEFGMTKQEVISLLGHPLKKGTLPPAVHEDHGVEYWGYKIWKDLQFFEIYFDAEGKVKQVDHRGWFQ